MSDTDSHVDHRIDNRVLTYQRKALTNSVHFFFSLLIYLTITYVVWHGVISRDLNAMTDRICNTLLMIMRT